MPRVTSARLSKARSSKVTASSQAKAASGTAGSVRRATVAPQQAAADLATARKILLDLLAIPGISGDEKAVADRVVKWLREAGCPSSAIAFDAAHAKTPVKGNVGNLIVHLPGTLPGPRRLLMAHMDTVPVCLGAKPVVAGKFVKSADPKTGLGGDDRAGVAVVLATAVQLLKSKLPHPPLTLLFAIQEEVGLYGARFVKAADLGRPRLAFNFDGGAVEKITVGATGGYRMDIAIEGIPSHAGVAPEKGVSAIAIAALAVASLVENGWHGLIEKDGKRGTSNVGVIHAGAATNVVAESATIRAEARGHDAAFRGKIVKAIEKAFADAVKKVKSVDGKTGRVTVEGRLDYEAFRLADDEPCVVAAGAAVRGIGLEPRLDISNGGLDANWMAANGVPTVTLGCGQMEIHTTNEKLDLATFENACRVALRLATGA
ncbi:MAG: M20/M25/M40 family metallo-hydrolase [Planctomycetia bacterium]|nr:M20/M25/M40 family metallo-hydrolase [Planctomycetia bacterium]